MHRVLWLLMFMNGLLAWGAMPLSELKKITESDDLILVQRQLRELPESSVESNFLREMINNVLKSYPPKKSDVLDLRGAIECEAVFRRSSASDPNAAVSIAKIKSNPLYRTPATMHRSNWIADGLKALGEAIARIFKFNPPKIQPQTMSSFGSVVSVIVYAAITLGILAALVAIGYGVRALLGRTKKLKKGLIEDEEASLSLDEWLKRADQLEAQGQFREACRCLYVAMLIRLDESNVMRFIGSQTNWEHHKRFIASPSRPKDFQLRPSTELFDLVWYGNHVRGKEDVAELRTAYQSLLTKVRGRA